MSAAVASDSHQLPLAPPPEELPPPESLLPKDDPPPNDEPDQKASSVLTCCGITLSEVSVLPQCWQDSVIVSRPLWVLVGSRTRSTVLLRVR